jgi:hypothetical protein
MNLLLQLAACCAGNNQLSPIKKGRDLTSTLSGVWL